MTDVQLFIDTTIYGAVIGLKHAASKEIECFMQTEEVADSAKMLPVMVQQALDSMKSSVEDIKSITVSRGPGSFTGIRVGLAYTIGLVSGLSKTDKSRVKVNGVSSLVELHRYFESVTHKNLALFLPSTKSTGYAVVRNGDQAQLHAIDCGEEFFANWNCRDWFVLGDWPILEEIMARNDMKSVQKYGLKTASELALRAMVEGSHLLRESENAQEMSDPEEFPDAIYLRKSSVEENQKKKLG